MSLRNTTIIVIVSIVITFIVTRYLFPQIQTKTVEITKEVVKTDIQTVVHTITLPNGSTDTTTTTTDHSVKTDTSKNTSQINLKPRWLISGSAQSGLDLKPYYGLQVQRRILGPFYLGALLNTQGEIGLSLGAEF